MKKRSLAILVAIAAIAALGAGLFAGPTAARLVYDMYGTNALVRNVLKVEGLAELQGVQSVVYDVNNVSQLVTVGGASVFVIDHTLGNEFRVDPQAIYESAEPTTITGLTAFQQALTGVTVVDITVTAAIDRYTWEVVKWDSGATPVYEWAPQISGVTPIQNMAAPYHTGSAWAVVTGQSCWQIDSQYDRIRSRAYDESGASVVKVPLFITGT